jgi:hypothetical protein
MRAVSSELQRMTRYLASAFPREKIPATLIKRRRRKPYGYRRRVIYL